MLKPIIMVVVVVLLALSSLAFQKERPLGVASTLVAAPQAKCQGGFIYIQFQGEAGWVQTMKKCDMRATPPKLDTTKVRERLTQVQLDSLLNSYLSGNPSPQGVNVCCCQPGWQVYDSTAFHCSSTGKLVSLKEH
jgi:hypothetical protein